MQENLTPLMQQYFAIKKEHPEALLLFQVGDFYELFFEDAKTAAHFLGITLTARGKNKGEPIPLCGVPVHALDHYLTKLVKGGFHVAICDQLEQPVPGKVVERGVTQVLTPGTLIDSKLLDAKSASYLFSFFPTKDSWGLLFGELLTAQLYATVLPATSDKVLEAELIRFFPDEVLLPASSLSKPFEQFFKTRGYCTTLVHDVGLERDQVLQWQSEQLSAKSAQKIQEHESLQQAVAAFYAYMKKNQQAALHQFKSIQFYKPEDFLILDAATQRNLELITNTQDGGRKNSLFATLDRAVTAMGSRMIKKWLMRPLVKKEAIVQRQDAVQLFMHDAGVTQKVEQILDAVGDIERVIGRIALVKGQLSDYIALQQALHELPTLVSILQSRNRIALIEIMLDSFADFSLLAQLLHAALNTEFSKPWIIKPGFDQALDRVRELVENAQQKILEFEQREQQRTGIGSLKVRYNSAHGYSIEITKANLDSVPSEYVRYQTLVGRERFTTPELRTLQDEITNAKGLIDQLEKTIFEKIKQEVAAYISPLRRASYALAHLDGLIGFAKVAAEFGYARPQFNSNQDIIITAGKHPVVLAALHSAFIANDTHLNDCESLLIITGPNMGGKSTYLRQVALICLMAQCGSFVPAAAADLPLLDRIFTRIGAGDNVAEGKSTFLVEMEETATICLQSTKNSLVILDEVGRGTSTYDGLAIAQAVVEYIAQKVKARCLFATHYQELTLLASRIDGIASYYAASKKSEDGILFLYKIVPGVADGSFGVEVAKLAGLPSAVIGRAQQILHELQQMPTPSHGAPSLEDKGGYTQQLEDQVLALRDQLAAQQAKFRQITDLDFNNLSPRQAFDLLWSLQETNKVSNRNYYE